MPELSLEAERFEIYAVLLRYIMRRHSLERTAKLGKVEDSREERKTKYETD